jgi:hypothetical protein
MKLVSLGTIQVSTLTFEDETGKEIQVLIGLARKDVQEGLAGFPSVRDFIESKNVLPRLVQEEISGLYSAPDWWVVTDINQISLTCLAITIQHT